MSVFPRERGLSGMSVSDRGPIHVGFDNSPPGQSPPVGILMGFSEADEAKKPRRYIDHVSEHDEWEHDEWSAGCYGAFMPPGLWTSVGPSLRKPVGRVHWAGTETATVWTGYIDGAISSAERAAAEIAD